MVVVTNSFYSGRNSYTFMEIGNIVEGEINRLLKRNNDLVETRRLICSYCDFYLKASDRCGKCGCPIERKGRAEKTHCPINKW